MPIVWVIREHDPSGDTPRPHSLAIPSLSDPQPAGRFTQPRLLHAPTIQACFGPCHAGPKSCKHKAAEPTARAEQDLPGYEAL